MSELPSSMTVVAIDRPGPPSVLVTRQAPVPRPGPGEVLIKVAAAGVNRPDLMQREGNYPPPPGASEIPGLEVAGTVVALGPDTQRWGAGDRVMALLAGGGYAGYCVAPAGQVLPVPETLPLTDAAAVPETFFTVWVNLFERARLRPGESVLVHGGASGIGTTAIQLARAFGATVFATAGGREKCRACERLGAEHGIDYRGEDFVAAVKDATGGRGVDVVLDMVGGAYVERNVAVLAPDGRLAQIAWLGGAKIEANMAALLTKRLTWTGSTLRARPDADKAAIAQALEGRVWPLLAAGEVRPVIHATFPLEGAARAHALLEDGGHVGKVVLTVPEAAPPG